MPATDTRTPKRQRLARALKDECLELRIRILYRVITEHYDAMVVPHGVTSSQYNILAALSNAGELTGGELAEILSMDKTTVSRVSKHLLDGGLIAYTHGDDRRRKRYALTPEGWRVLEDSHDDWCAVQKRVRALLGDDGVRRLHDLADPIFHANIQRTFARRHA